MRLPQIPHYIPQGDRKTWSQAQYIVYKEEKDRARDTMWRDWVREDMARQSKFEETYLHGRQKTILAMVTGRTHGDRAAEKTSLGLPVDSDREPSGYWPPVSPLHDEVVHARKGMEMLKRAKRPK